jgi:NADP-dependent 3-hydroxy acid dehydrogenase YdfG
MAPLVWLVTGTTSGIGAALVNHIVERGDNVIATGRKVEQRLSHLKSDSLAVLELDISAGRQHIQEQVKKAWEIFGGIDVVVNNAGISAMKSAEEAE